MNKDERRRLEEAIRGLLRLLPDPPEDLRLEAERKVPAKPARKRTSTSTKIPAAGVRELSFYWCDRFEDRYRKPWTMHAMHYSHLASALKMAEGDVDIVKGKIDALINSSDRWIVMNLAPSLLVSRFNQLALRPDQDGDYGGGDGEVEVAQ